MAPRTAPPAAPSRSPTAASICCTSATSATCRRPRARPIGSSSRSTTIASVRALKGPNRPILAEARSRRAGRRAARRRLRRHLSRSRPSTPLLLALKPDVHCKGTDYTVDTVPERETVRGYGGRIAIVGDPKDHSTRDLLSRIARARRRDRDMNILIVRLGRARRRRPRRAGRGGAAPGVSRARASTGSSTRSTAPSSIS